MLLNSSLGCSCRQHEAKFRIDLEASHQHHGEKGHTSQYKIHAGPTLPSFSRTSDSRSQTPSPSNPHNQCGALPSSVILGAASDLTVTHVKSAAKGPALNSRSNHHRLVKVAQPGHEHFVQNCRPLGPGHPSTFHL